MVEVIYHTTVWLVQDGNLSVDPFYVERRFYDLLHERLSRLVLLEF